MDVNKAMTPSCYEMHGFPLSIFPSLCFLWGQFNFFFSFLKKKLGGEEGAERRLIYSSQSGDHYCPQGIYIAIFHFRSVLLKSVSLHLFFGCQEAVFSTLLTPDAVAEP